MTKSEIPPIKKTDNCYEDIDINKTQLFNEHFITQSTVDDSGVDLPPLTYNQTCSIDNIDITETDVKDVLDNLDISKATGPDGINPRLLKEASSELCGPLSKFFNRSLEISKYPSIWKEANVSPIYKKDDPSLVKNYRPISLLNILGKVMERCIFKHIYNYIVSNNLLTPLQSGFRQKDSTIFQLLDITNQFGKALDDGKEIRVIFCDISKAFDRVWHLGLIHKLSTFGISGSLLSWFSDYLHFRRQRVVINGTSSDWLEITAGFPQGSILGPLLFLIYINDIVTDIRSNIRLFADDTSLYIIIENPVAASETLNFDLDTIHKWSSNWLVDFNPQKTTDIWALGVIVYELATLGKPFDATSMYSLVNKVVNGELPPMPEKDYSEGLIKLMKKMLCKKPGLRPSAMEILGDSYFKPKRPLPEPPKPVS
ncbi:hypothetical protein FSP39_021305 [Pinctada imbricata]|uniref:Reverse transcriptase domain-containing protein n=1 Tax=Pinctada imbricata TaxID=66713 RepID=A0AA88YQP2_PINIB|nr:hypothetical protein FSP39_021305 [Pinctada imbricata]